MTTEEFADRLDELWHKQGKRSRDPDVAIEVRDLARCRLRNSPDSLWGLVTCYLDSMATLAQETGDELAYTKLTLERCRASRHLARENERLAEESADAVDARLVTGIVGNRPRRFRFQSKLVMPDSPWHWGFYFPSSDRWTNGNNAWCRGLPDLEYFDVEWLDDISDLEQDTVPKGGDR